MSGSDTGWCKERRKGGVVSVTVEDGKKHETPKVFVAEKETQTGLRWVGSITVNSSTRVCGIGNSHEESKLRNVEGYKIREENKR